MQFCWYNVVTNRITYIKVNEVNQLEDISEVMKYIKDIFDHGPLNQLTQMSNK